MTAAAYNSNIYSTRQRGNVDAAPADMRIRLHLLSIDIKQFDTADIPCIHSKDEQTLADNRHADVAVVCRGTDAVGVAQRDCVWSINVAEKILAEVEHIACKHVVALIVRNMESDAVACVTIDAHHQQSAGKTSHTATLAAAERSQLIIGIVGKCAIGIADSGYHRHDRRILMLVDSKRQLIANALCMLGVSL